MGDADSEVIIPVHEIEAWMDEALEVVDEGLEQLFSFMTSLNERTRQVILELKNVECLRRCFLSLNIFIVPVILAIVLCYGVRESINSNNSHLEKGIEMTVTLLMFISGAFGLPFYLYSLWESYCMAAIIRKEYEKIRLSSSQDFHNTRRINESLLTLLSNEASVERLNEFSRLLSNRMPDGMRSEMERRTRPLERPNDFEGFGARILRRNESSEPVPMDPVTESTNSKDSHGESKGADSLYMTDSSKQDEDFPIAYEVLHGSDTTYMNDGSRQDGGFPIVYQVQVRMHEKSPDLSIKIEPTSDGKTGKDSVRHGRSDRVTLEEFNLLQTQGDTSQEDPEDQESEVYEVPSENPQF